MAAFCWMLCEGIIIFILLYFIFYNGFFKSKKFFFLVGWGKFHTVSKTYKTVYYIPLDNLSSDVQYICILTYLHIGLPVLIVAISVGVAHRHYGINDRWVDSECCIINNNNNVWYRCWISEEEGAIWAFIGPMLLIILVLRTCDL